MYIGLFCLVICIVAQVSVIDKLQLIVCWGGACCSRFLDLCIENEFLAGLVIMLLLFNCLYRVGIRVMAFYLR